MTTTVTRLYETSKQASDAVTALKTAGFADDEIRLIGPDAGAGSALVAAIMKTGATEDNAKVYAEGVSKGGGLVTVYAPFGWGLKATNTLERMKPVAVRITDTGPFANDTGDALVSEVLGIPLLLRGGPPKAKLIHETRPASSATAGAPFSRATSGKPFSKLTSGTLGSWIGLPEIIRDR
jgi:hypothetical protein